MKKGRRKLNQQGMSLVELIVVILIIGILSATAFVGVSYVNRMDATGAAEKLASMLNRTRVRTLSADLVNTPEGPKSSVELVLVKDGDDYYARILENSVEVDSVVLGNSGLEITVTEKDGATETDYTVGGTPFKFSYKKENGAFEDSCKYIAVTVSGSKTKTVRLVHETGRSYIE